MWKSFPIALVLTKGKSQAIVLSFRVESRVKNNSSKAFAAEAAPYSPKMLIVSLFCSRIPFFLFFISQILFFETAFNVSACQDR